MVQRLKPLQAGCCFFEGFTKPARDARETNQHCTQFKNYFIFDENISKLLYLFLNNSGYCLRSLNPNAPAYLSLV
jgi:hypothetical protein